MARQQTIRDKINISGIGLHTGQRVDVTLLPAPENNGIIFTRIDLATKPAIEAKPANIFQSDKSLQRTSIKKHGAEVHTIEHLLAALSGLSIDNVLIDINGAEFPAMDGSAGDLADILQEVGFKEQNAPKKVIEIKEPIACQDNDSSIEVVPHPKFKIDYFLEFKQPWLKSQFFSASIDTSDESMRFFREEIAPSRTFCLEEEAMGLLKAGLGKGANFENTLVINQTGPINNKLRFSDELARHKLLDLLGDLYLLGGHIKGHITARKSGHKLNAIFIKRLDATACSSKNPVAIKKENL